MGVYLSKPKTDKTYEEGSGKNMSWGAMGMQGNFSNFRLEN